jgi:hypothetical protein
VDGELRGGAERDEHRFVLRIWREPSASGPEWHGSVVEVNSALSVASGELNELLDFIKVRLDRSAQEQLIAAVTATRLSRSLELGRRSTGSPNIGHDPHYPTPPSRCA